MEGSEARQLRLLVISASDRARKDTEWEIACRDCMSIGWTCSSLMKPCCVRLLRHVYTYLIYYLTHMCAQGVKWSSLSFFHSFIRQKILRLHDLAHFRPSDLIISILILLLLTCYWANSPPLTVIPAVFLLSSPLYQPFTATSHAYK